MIYTEDLNPLYAEVTRQREAVGEDARKVLASLTDSRVQYAILCNVLDTANYADSQRPLSAGVHATLYRTFSYVQCAHDAARAQPFCYFGVTVHLEADSTATLNLMIQYGEWPGFCMLSARQEGENITVSLREIVVNSKITVDGSAVLQHVVLPDVMSFVINTRGEVQR